MEPFTPSPEQPKLFEQNAAEAIKKQEAALDAIEDKNPVQDVAVATIRVANQDLKNQG